MKKLIIILTILIVAAGCGDSDEIENPKKTDAIVYNTNRYHIGRGLYEHKVMYAYSVDSVKYYGEFIEKDWTLALTSGYDIADVLSIEYNAKKPEESKFTHLIGNYKGMELIN